MSQPERTAAAALVSGGLDSAILCVELLREFPRVVPIYVRSGLRWEDAEVAALECFLAEVGDDRLDRVVRLDEPIADVYGDHWSTIGAGVPGSDTDDEAVYLPGRNLLLTVKAAVWCRLRGVRTLALGSLGSNPFPDSTPEFFSMLEAVLDQAMDGGPRLIRPFAALAKAEVLARGRGLPLHLTFSCIDPRDGRHCGRCNKCAERKKGLRDAGSEGPDPLFRISPVGACFTGGDLPTIMYRVTREIAFCYGHRLLNYDGKCRHLHGHNGRAVITLEGPGLDRRGMLVDFGEIKRRIQSWIDENLDHNMLLCRDDPLLPTLRERGERVFVMDENPTAENIARLIYERGREAGLPIVEVVLWETDNCCSAYAPVCQ